MLQRRKSVLYRGSMRHKPTPTFILALPLQVNAQQAARLHAHFECARQFYNALLAEAMKRLTGVGACRPERFADPHQEPVAFWEASEAVLVAQEPL